MPLPNRISRIAFSIGLVAFSLAGGAAAQSPDPGILRILYSEHAGMAQNEVPGLPGAVISSITKVRVSPAGVVGAQVLIHHGG